MAAARKGNLGSAVMAGPLLWAGCRPVDLNHNRFGMLRSDAIPTLLPQVTQHSAALTVRFPCLWLDWDSSHCQQDLCSIPNRLDSRCRA